MQTQPKVNWVAPTPTKPQDGLGGARFSTRQLIVKHICGEESLIFVSKLANAVVAPDYLFVTPTTRNINDTS